MKLLLFDIDGTLLHTGGAGRIAFNRTFRELFSVPDAWADTVPDGKTDPALIREIAARTLKKPLTPEKFRSVCRVYLKHFKNCIKRTGNFRLMPGVPRLLRLLSKRRGVFLGLATGNFEESSRLKLRRGKIERFFLFGGFGSHTFNRLALTREAIRRGQRVAGQRIPRKNIFVIGDTVYDIRAGKRLGIRTVGVATGKTTRAELGRCRPDYVLSDLKDAKKILRLLA